MSQEAMKPAVPAAPVEGQQQEQQKPKETPVADPRLEQLAKRERAFRAQQRQFQQEQQKFKEQQESLSKSQQLHSDFQNKIKTDFIGAAIEAGYTPEQISQQLMNTTSETAAIKALNAKIAVLEAQLPKVVEDVKATQSKAYDQAIKQVARDVKLTVEGNESYELINSKGKVGQDAVLEYIKSTYEEDGILLSADEAAKEVEEYLLEEATALAKLKKVQAKLAPPAKEEAPKTPPQKTPTLTNQASTSTPSGKLTAAERRQRAILAMTGQLK